MKLQTNWSYPTQIRFGAGRIAELPEAVAEAGMRRPLLVTDSNLADAAIVQDARQRLRAAGFGDALFADVSANPTDRDMAAGVAAFRAGGHDGVVAMGGGSGLDLGKIVAFMAGQTRPVWDFEDIGDYWRRADAAAIAPSVAVPTTAGTGSEVGRASVVARAESGVKKIIFHPKILPAVVIADPALTVGMPPWVTAGTGMDAFVHCLEAYVAPSFHPMGVGIALEGMRLVKENLLTAYRDGEDLAARAQMMAAASMGAVAFQKGLGGVHAISHAVAALNGGHHGTINAVALLPVLAFNRPAITAPIERAAAYLGITGGYDGFLAFVQEKNAALNIPTGLGALGVTAAQAPALARIAIEDPSAGGNPIPLDLDTVAGLIVDAI